jgi:SAM-dependent methyltransferase
MDDPFSGIADSYDRMFPRDISEDNLMLRQLFKGHNISTVLDCACGTGPHLAMLARKGYKVTGSDSSEAMLAGARRRLDAAGIEAELVRSYWNQLPRVLDRKFDAVICIGNSLPLAGGDDQVAEAIHNMYEMVSDGGVLVIQNRNIDKMVLERPDAILNRADEPGAYTLFVFEYRDGMVIYKVFHIVTIGVGEVTGGEFPMNLLTRKKFEKMLRATGAVSWRVFGDSGLSAFSRNNSPRMIVAVDK